LNKLSDITAVIVIYNVTSIIFDCLKKLKNIDVIIIDNGRNSKEIVKSIKENKNIIKYFKSKKNLGFGRACNFGFKHVKTKYTLFIEPDVFIDNENLQKLVSGFDEYPSAGILVPTLVRENGEIKDNLGNLPELNNRYDSPMSKNIYDQIWRTNISGNACLNFCWAAILLVNNNKIKKVGLFNKKIFLFWEDFELCRKLKSTKIQIIKIFSARAIHLIRMSTKKSYISHFIMEKHHILSSYVYFKINKKDNFLIRKMFVYFFRSISYLLIFNLKNSIKNLAKLCAVISYKNK